MQAIRPHQVCPIYMLQLHKHKLKSTYKWWLETSSAVHVSLSGVCSSPWTFIPAQGCEPVPPFLKQEK